MVAAAAVAAVAAAAVGAAAAAAVVAAGSWQMYGGPLAGPEICGFFLASAAVVAAVAAAAVVAAAAALAGKSPAAVSAARTETVCPATEAASPVPPKPRSSLALGGRTLPPASRGVAAARSQPGQRAPAEGRASSQSLWRSPR